MTNWTKIDPDNPPALHLVALYSDGSGAEILTKFDNDNFRVAEDGWQLESLKDFSWWAPAPEEFVPHFMTVTEDDWR